MNTRHTDARTWDVDLSTRQSMHPATRYTPISGTASTTATDVFTIDRNEAAVNLVLNPSIEGTDISAFVASGAGLTRVSSQADAGSYSLEVNPAGSAANEGFYYDTGGLGASNEPLYLTAQCTVKKTAAGAGTFKIEILPAGGTPGTGALATSATHTLTTSFATVNVQYAIPGGTSDTGYRIAFVSQAQHDINMYVDNIMVEVRKDMQISDYVDGDQGNGYSWEGAANASYSKRKVGMVQIKGLKIMNDTGSNAIYVALDATASATTGIKVNGGETLETQFPIDFRDRVSIVAAAGTPAYHGVVWGMHY